MSARVNRAVHFYHFSTSILPDLIMIDRTQAPALNEPMNFFNDSDESPEDLRAELERLKAENAALKKAPARGALSLKVSEKGAVSVYGMGRFPVTLYKEQWLKLLGMADEIQKFIKENDSRLKTKD